MAEKQIDNKELISEAVTEYAKGKKKRDKGNLREDNEYRSQAGYSNRRKICTLK